MSKHRTHGAIRRLISGLLCLALTLGLLPSGIVLPARAASWADPYGEKLVEWGVMRGDISGNLNLDRPITRAELVTMINRAYGYSRKAGIPFTDVPSSKWYADDIDIAYNAGYFKGTSSNRASPESNVTREQAAVFLARNLMLQETVGETLGFTDSRTLSEWSRGLIGAAVQEGVLNGYSDGSFKPANNITRGEVAAMLVRAIGTPVNKEGSHTLGHVYGNVTLSASNVTLRDTTIAGNLYLTGGIDLGHVLLENVTVLGKIIVSGAGEAISGQESVTLRNVEAEELVVDSLRSPFVTVKVQGVTDIPLVTVRTNAYLDDSSWEGYGLSRIELRGDPGSKLQLAGSIKEVMNFTPASDLQFVKGSAEKVTVDEDATASRLLVDKNTRVDELNLDVGTTVSGAGDIGKLNVGASGSEVEQLPDQIVIRPGITADVDGETLGSSDAAELSAEPRLMAGYPYMKNIAPTQADGVFSGSKPGTIYWAISAVADGSVSEEDLIENPTYGGNIFEKQAGSIDAASAKTEYVGKVQQLEPDGTYYVSAILVDGRGKRSPLKVMSFATPDDTKPAFVKDPTMTKTTTDVAQATVMANKSCLLYWALLPEGAQAPTPQEFKTGSVGGNYGYGSLSLMKNAEISVTVNRQKLREKQTYDLFLWLTDHNGAQSMDAPFKITFTTPDETPPVVTAPTQMPPYGADFANVIFSMNEAPATLYWAVVPEGDTTFIAPGDTPEETAEIMADLRTKIRVEGAGDSATASGSAAVTGAYTDTSFRITGLDTAKTGTNNYTMYYIGKDAAGNYSDRVRSISIKTLDTTPPTVEQQFADAVEGRPRASSDIRLVFSETVKGGSRADTPTFLDFYQEVLESAGNPTLQKEAKNRLAEELAKHIKMYSVPRNGQPVLLEPKGDNQTDDKWVIDFHNVVVEQVNGQMIITLPNDTNLNNSALKLDSGATYYFQLLSVYDNAFIPNGVMDDPNGNYRLDNFTTIYGQVELARNTSVTSIESVGTADAAYNGIRLDMCVDVKPESTGKMPETEYWDMIIWSDTWIEVEIYYQKDDGAWELLNPVNDIPIQKDAVIGLGSRTEVTSTSHRIQPVKSSLLEGSTYRYGIHITHVGGISEGTTDADRQNTPQNWNAMVTMKFSLVAGTQGDIQNLSASPANYDKFVNEDKTATEIGIEYLQTGTRRILEYPRQFTDTRVPEFVSGYPTFEAGSGTISMRAPLMREGKVWWVAAPADPADSSKDLSPIPTSLQDGTMITVNNHNDLTGSSYTYIPTSGSDRDGASKDHIYFMTGNNGEPQKYGTPAYGNIIDGQNFYRSNPDAKAGVYEYTGSADPIPITGLKPETWYYIYIVRQGGGDPNQIVEIYKVQTTKVNVPSIVVNGTSTTATMTPSEDCELSFALVEYNSLPDFIRNAASGSDTVLKQMMERDSGTTGPSKFDKTTDNDLKKQVAEYVLGSSAGTGTAPVGTWTLPDGQEYKDPISKGQSVTWNFEDEMTSTSSEYVLLVIARHRYGGTGGADYGFGAVRALYTPDKVPPVYVNDNKDSRYHIASIKCDDTTAWGNGTWQDRPNAYTYSGTVTIGFSKDIYFHDNTNNTRYDVVYDTAATGQKSLLDIMGGSAVINGHIEVPTGSTGKVGSSITLSVKGIEAGEQIVIFASGQIANRSDYTTRYRLTLTFDPFLMRSNFYDGVIADTGMPGFQVSWVEVRN